MSRENQPAPPEQRLPLAFSERGAAVAPPKGATGFQVRRVPLKGAGRAAVVYDDEGDPLTVPLDCTPEDLACEVGNAPGKYRLAWVDKAGRRLGTKKTECVHLIEGDETTSAKPEESEIVSKVLAHQSQMVDSLVGLLKQNQQVQERQHKALADALSTTSEQLAAVVGSAANIVGAADRAGMTSAELIQTDENGDPVPAPGSPIVEALNGPLGIALMGALQSIAQRFSEAQPAPAITGDTPK